MAIVDLKKDYVAGNKTNFGGALGKSTSKKEDSSFLGNLAYIGGNTAAGFGGVFEGIGRLVSSTGAKIAGDDRLARYYAKKSYIGEWQSDMAEKYSPDKVTQFFADAGAGVGQSSVFLLNLVAPGAGTVVFGAGVFGNSVGEAVNKTGQLGFKEYAYGGLSAGGEVLMEVISGATFKAVGRIGAGVSGNLTKNAVETTATQTAKKGFLKAVASNAVLKDLLKESSGEFIEEFLGDFWDVGISRLTGVDPEASTTLGQAIYSGMVGFASGAMMSGSSMVINRAAAASRGYHINESGNAQQMVRTAEVVLEEAKTAENFQDPAGVVDMLKESVESYNAQKDKTNFASRVALGQMQMFTAYIEKNIGVMQAYANIMKADAQTLEKYAQLASYYTNEKVTTRDLLANRDNITTQMAIRDWVNGVLTVDSDLVAEAEVRDFTRTTEGGNTSESTGETRFSMTGDDAKQELKNQLDRNATAAQEAQQTAQATEITQTSFDGGKSVQNVHIIDRMYLSIKKNSDGTYNYAINDKSAKQDANGGVWDKTNVPAEEMRQYFEQAKEGAVQYEAQKAAQTDQETQKGADGKTTVEGENAAQEREGAEKKAQEKPRQKSEIDSAAEKKLNKMIKGFNTMAYRDRVAVSRMVKSAEANGVDAKTVKKIAIAMTARSGLDIRFTKSISQNGTWTVFKDGSQRRLILLNPDIQSPLEQTFLHEFMHDMMHDQYTNMKAVMDVTSGMLEKGAFDNYVRERRDEYFDACAKAGREGLILTKNEDGTVTRSFASEKAEKAFDLMMREEATANFGAEFLYRRGFLTRVARSNQKLVLRAFRAIGRWINDVRSRDMETARALEGYFRTIEDAVRNSNGNSEIASLLFGSKPNAQNAETKSAAEGSEMRYSIQDGKVVVDTDQHIFDGVERKDYGRIVRAYMREHFRGKEIAGTMFTKTSEKEYTSSEYAKRLLRKKQGTYDAKMRASTELDNMLRISEYIGHEDAKHPHEYNGKGYDRYSVQFEIAGENFSGELLVAIGDNDRRIFYDVVKIKRTDSPVSEATARKSDGKSARGTIGSEVGDVHTVQNRNADASTTDSIHQNSENVKGKSKIGENTRFELPSKDSNGNALSSKQRDIDAGGYGGNVGAYYLNIKNPASESMGYKALNKFQGQNNAGVKAREYLESLGYDGVNNGGEEYIAFRSEQIKRIDNKNPTSDPDIRFELPSKKTDAEYLELAKDPVKNKERLTAMVREAAEKAGYSDDSSWRMQHVAPNSKEDISIAKLKGSGLVSDDFWQHPEWYTNTSEELESYYKVTQAIESMERRVAIGKPARAYMVVYRAVDKTVNTKETGFRNGDWVTPSREYAVMEGLMNQNGYRIIADRVDINNLYWDGNSIAELGYDDGKNYAYADTANYRKLLDPVTYDYDGTIIPLSKRFKRRNYDVRFELNSGTGYSRGQMSKIVANRTKGKVYSLSDAAIAIDNVTALVSGILSDENISFRAKIRGKSRAEVMDFLFEQMNKEQGNGRLNTALQAADYILNHAVVQEELDSVGREEYARMMDIITGVESYRGKFKFTEAEKADLKHMFDKGYPSLLRAWSSEDGMMPSRILAELKDSGITVDSASDVESDIFADLLGQYQNAKQAIKQWNESVLLNTVGDKRMLTKLKSDMAREILKAFETTGEKSAYRKEVEARQESISKMLEKNRAKLDASRKRSRSEYQLYRAGIDLEQRLKRDKRSNKLFQDVGVREIANAAVKLAKPRNARNPAAVLSFAKTMQGIYSPKNPLLAIYGEVDKKTGEYENTYYNPEVGDALNRLTQIDTEVYRRGKKVKNKYLTDAQVIDLQTVVSGIDRLYREYDTVYYQGKRVGLTETAQQGVDNLLWIEENRNKKGKKWYAPLKNFIGGYLRETVSPLVVVRNLEMHDPNGVLSKYYEEVVRGDLNTRTMTANLMDTFEKFYKENKGYQKALARDTVKFMGFEMSKAQAITLYCTMKSEHARLGFETFGFTYEDKNGNLVETGAIKNYDIKILYNAFNETDKRFISIVEQFFNETSRKIKTETDMRVIGSTNVLEDYYFPILRDRKQRGSNVGDMRKAMMNTLETVNNISANQNRIEHADGRLDIYDVTAIIERHAVAMATYANLYEPIQSFERVLNARVGQRDENGKLIRQTETTIGELMEKLYPGFRDSFTKLFGDIQGVKASREGVWDTVGKGIEKAQGLYASAVVSGNIKTAMLPPMSMFAAGSLIDMKYISRSLTMNNTKEARKASYEEMEKYSSVIKGRYYDRGAIKARTVQDSVRGVISVTGKGIEITEKFMINKLWSACKLQTSEQLGLAFDSDENCRAAAKLFDKVVTETQSQYVPSMKSSLARHNNVIVRGFTQFKSDGQAMLGSLYDNVRGYFDLKERKKAGQNVDAELKAAKKRAARSIPSIAAVCVGVAIITQGMRYLFNNDDEDDETPVKNIAMNTLNSAMGMFPLVGDVYSVFAEGYDISNMTLDALNDGVNGIKAMTSLIGNDNATQADVARATRKALYGVGHMAGVPVRNLTNLTTGVIRRISKPAMYGYDSIFSGEKYSEDLQRAVKRGDDKMAEAITKVMFRRKKTGAYNQETLDEVLRLYKAGYDKKVMPGGIPDDLTRAQRKTFLNVYGKSDADVQKLIESDAYKAFDDEQKASAISSLYRSWRAYAEYQATGETDDKSALLSEIMGADKFGKARAYLSGLKAKENAETPKDGWRSTIQKGLKGMGLTSDEQALMLYAAGYHSASDLSSFLRVLNAKNLTKEQLALFAEIFKLDVKNGKLVERKTEKKTA